MRRDTECFEAHQYILTACLAVEDLSKTTTAVNVRSRLCGAALIVRSLAAVLQLVHQPLAVCSAARCRLCSAQRTTAAARRTACA